MTIDLPPPPRAEQRPFSYERHGVTINDPWAWLRDKGYPKVTDADVLAYLKAENAYFEGAMAPHQALLETLFEEMKGRIKEDDSSVPVKDGDWLYWWAFEPGAQYRSWYRKAASKAPFVPSEVEGRISTSLDSNGIEKEAQLIFDEPTEAEGKD
jgi:oligopeptidase B